MWSFSDTIYMVKSKLTFLDQCITVRQRTARLSVCALQRTILPHFFCISLWQFIFFSCCTLSMLHFFYTAPFTCCTFLCNNLFMLHFFRVTLFFCIVLFHVALLRVALFSFCILLQFHSSHVDKNPPTLPKVSSDLRSQRQ